MLPDEPDAATWLRAGPTLVTASGDKLLGGPQAGLLLGRAELIRPAGQASAGAGTAGRQADVAALEATLAGPPVPVAASTVRRSGGAQQTGETDIAALVRRAGLDARRCDCRPPSAAAAARACRWPARR